MCQREDLMKLINEITKIFPLIEKHYNKEELHLFRIHDFGVLFKFEESLGRFIHDNFLYTNPKLLLQFENVGIKHQENMIYFILELFYVYCNEKND